MIEVWGAERQFLVDGGSRFDGNVFRDDIFGGAGDDIITGEAGFDRLIGGLGNDKLRGGRNGDEVRGGRGNDTLFGGRGHDIMNGGKGNDIIRGGLGSDLFELSPGIDLIEDFRPMDNDRLGLKLGSSYELMQIGVDMQIATSYGLTTLLGVSIDHFVGENHIVRL